MKEPKVSKWYLFRKHLSLIREHGGFYVTDCTPWQIKTGCDRLDCPMRSIAIPPEAKESDYLIECDPVGTLADLLKIVRDSQSYTEGGNDSTG